MLAHTPAATTIRDATPSDAAAIARIYNHYVAETVITFEEQAVADGDMAARVQEVHAQGLPWLVGHRGGSTAGYAYASTWKRRCAYRHSVEVTVYLDPLLRGLGVGSMLYSALLEALTTRGLHVAIGGIALPNAASVALHEKLGFAKVAHFREVGFKHGRWIDVGYWQRFLDGPASGGDAQRSGVRPG
jgi:L-amino acid N-acyltransferase YncA